MPRSRRISSAEANRSASIQRRSGTRPRAKLQKSQLALQEFVTAILHSPGPPRPTMRSTSQTCASFLDTFLLRGTELLLPQYCPQFDSGRGRRFVPTGTGGVRRFRSVLKTINLELPSAQVRSPPPSLQFTSFVATTANSTVKPI